MMSGVGGGQMGLRSQCGQLDQKVISVCLQLPGTVPVSLIAHVILWCILKHYTGACYGYII